MTHWVYVDNSNVWIEGQRVSALRSGLATDIWDAMRRRIVDPTWTYDFGELYKLACPDHEKFGRTALFGSTPPSTDSIWDMARREGFEVLLFPRNSQNREKQVDTSIGTMIVEDSFIYMKPGDTVVLLAGDGDFVPPLHSVRSRGFTVKQMFWSHGSKMLREEADEFVDLDPYFGQLSRKASVSTTALDAPMPPPMPQS
jgi:uncharacterized LabA/DUF88 family protein